MVLLSGHWPPRGLLSGWRSSCMFGWRSSCMVRLSMSSAVRLCRYEDDEALVITTHKTVACRMANYLRGMDVNADSARMCAPAGQWPLQEAAVCSDSGSDSDAQRPSGSFSDVGACLTSDGGASPRETTTSPSAAVRGFGVAAGTGSIGRSNSSNVAVRRRRRRRRRQQQSSSRRHSGSVASGLYLPVVHCGSVRQAARVVAMREVALDDDAALGEAGLPLCGPKYAMRWGQFQRIERAHGLAAVLGLPETHRVQ